MSDKEEDDWASGTEGRRIEDTEEKLDADYEHAPSFGLNKNALSKTSIPRSSRRGSKHRPPRLDVSTNFVPAPSGSIDVPLLLVLDKDVAHLKSDHGGGKVSFQYGFPRRDKWEAKLQGQSAVKGHLGYASGGVHVGYHVIPGRCILHANTHLGDEPKNGLGTTVTSGGTTMDASITSFVQSHRPFLLSIEARRDLWPHKVAGAIGINWMAPQKKRGHQLVSAHVGVTTLFRILPKADLRINLWNHLQLPVQLKVQHDTRNRGKSLDGNMTAASFSVGKRGIQWSGMITRSLSNVTALTIGVRHVTWGNLTWVFRLKRGDMTFTIPICIATSAGAGIDGVRTLYISFLTALIDLGVGSVIHGALDVGNGDAGDDGEKANTTSPVNQDERLLKQKKARFDAEQQTLLMARQAKNKKKLEESRNGLVIVNAVYFVNNGASMDATTQLQFWVSDCRLELATSSKAQMLGFYDLSQQKTAPYNSSAAAELTWHDWWNCLWEEPAIEEIESTETAQLRVQYKVGDALYEITIWDDAPLSLPNPHAIRIYSHDGSVTIAPGN
uniref:DnaJ-like protein C11 C-terminal domain-containing protein n=1 Tax=Attheya septentrionalis TaxID=420275 RepID=A0A7S2UNA1_9STRA|mmetsp:Transcript_5697/g.10058  ORF Transcript_5697/g.10058 Transcript_5697/m.10058 type:complete len:556 (+) Transcript_5697:72-1739(+)